MALPESGLITLAMIAAEFGGSPPYSLSQFYRGAGLVTANNTSVPTSGTISLSQFHGALKVVPGSVAYTTPGTYTFVVPAFSVLTVDVRGAGGGGGGWNYAGTWGDPSYNGGAGGYSYFNTPVNGNIIGYGGGGGQGLVAGRGSPTTGAAGAHGTAANGNIANEVGNGAAGGAAAIVGGVLYYYYPGRGGNGGRAVFQWTRAQQDSQLPAGTAITVVVGAGGGNGWWGAGDPYLNSAPTPGANGAVYISWN